MKNRAYAIPFVTLCVSAFLYSGLAAADDNAPGAPKSAAYRVANIAQAGASEFAPQSTQYPSNFRLGGGEQAFRSAGLRIALQESLSAMLRPGKQAGNAGS